MKICFVGLTNLPVLAREYNNHYFGGAEVQQTLLAKALAARGYQVSAVVGDYGQPDAAAWNGVTTYKAYNADAGLPVLRFIHPRWTGLWAALIRADADIYYTSCAGMLVGLVAMFCRRHQRGLIHKLAHDTDTDPKKLLIRYGRDKKLYEYGLRRADIVLSQHAGQRRALTENYGVASVVVDPLVEPSARHLDHRQRDLEILWVSNLRDLKRPDLAIDLAARMPCRHIHMIGGRMPGFTDLYEKIAAIAQELTNLTFYGHVPYHDIGDYYERAKVFVNTSDTEGFPNTFLQSWRRGVPTVSFHDPDGLIKREGLGVSPHSIDEMAVAVDDLIGDEPEWRKTSERCRGYMERMHGDDVVLKPYIAALEQAVRQRNDAH
jgi:glycosyltransferase involved in cell wall biosynthesis